VAQAAPRTSRTPATIVSCLARYTTEGPSVRRRPQDRMLQHIGTTP
jgi:hypothetical protein